jgi:hypothetical protein
MNIKAWIELLLRDRKEGKKIKAWIDFFCSENRALGEKEQLFVSKISDICAAADLSRAASGVCSVYCRRISPCSEFGGRRCQV